MTSSKAPFQSGLRLAGAAAMTMLIFAGPLCSQISKPVKHYVEPAGEATRSGGSGIRPFRVHVPEKAIADLRRRLAATNWPE